MAIMMKKTKPPVLSQKAIDEQVIAQADMPSAWGPSVRVRRKRRTSIPLPAELAAQAAFFARLHHEPNLKEWLAKIVQERLDLEEAALAGLKRQLAGKHG
jgi:hypothetical protein